MWLKIFAYMFLCANVHALWEIQIEGKSGGWAHYLPTWRWNVFWRKFLGGKPLTGYHVLMMIMYQLSFHIPIIFIRWNMGLEFITQGLFCWYFVMEDFLWFLWNPAYRFKRFYQRDIEWHRRWFFNIPISYWWGIIGGTVLILLGGL